MSKSTGNFITARHYVEQGINTDFFRYYIASKISSKIDDVNFSQEEFTQKVNTDVVGKFVKLTSSLYSLAPLTALQLETKPVELILEPAFAVGEETLDVVKLISLP